MKATTKKPTTLKSGRMTKVRRLAELKALVDLCFFTLGDSTGGDLKEVANLTGLSVSTLRRLQNDSLTLAVHFGTIQALGLAAGLVVQMTPAGVHLSVVD